MPVVLYAKSGRMKLITLAEWYRIAGAGAMSFTGRLAAKVASGSAIDPTPTPQPQAQVPSPPDPATMESPQTPKPEGRS
jgi:hypothetical protein